jgi:hypothetical protein
MAILLLSGVLTLFSVALSSYHGGSSRHFSRIYTLSLIKKTEQHHHTNKHTQQQQKHV